MLLIGVALVVALDARFIILIRAGAYYTPVCATLVWLNTASYSLRQLWPNPHLLGSGITADMLHNDAENDVTKSAPVSS